MSFHNLSISVLKVGRQLAGSLAVAAFFMLAIVACIKEEEPIPPRPIDTSLLENSIVMGKDYRYQAFYSLEKDSMLSRNLKFDWDVAFDASAEGTRMYLNSAKYMFAASVSSNFDLVKDTAGFFKTRAWDASNTPDSVAVADIKGSTKTYLIDRGFDENGDPLPFVKIKFEAVNDKKIKFKYANVSDPNAKQMELTKDPAYNLTYFSFKTNAEIKVEPKKEDWDLQFTQYIHTFNDPYIIYLVTGVLINPYNTTVAVDSTTAFNAIDRSFTEKMTFKNSPDAIGYNWKDFINNAFVVKTNYNYVIKTNKKSLFKLHFTDFYDEKGVKGTPRFEFQRL